jgi:hypothetical protein
MGLGWKKFWRTVATIGLNVAPGGVLVKSIGGMVLSTFLAPDSDEQRHFQTWVAYAAGMEDNPHIDGAAKWQALMGLVHYDLERYYGKEPKNYDVLFNASAALKEARSEFDD